MKFESKWMQLYIFKDVHLHVPYAKYPPFCSGINPLWPSDVVWRHRSGSTEVQVLETGTWNNVDFSVSEVLWHLESNFTGNDIYPWSLDVCSKIVNSRFQPDLPLMGQWLNVLYIVDTLRAVNQWVTIRPYGTWSMDTQLRSSHIDVPISLGPQRVRFTIMTTLAVSLINTLLELCGTPPIRPFWLITARFRTYKLINCHCWWCSGTGLSPVRWQAIIWSNIESWSVRSWRTNSIRFESMEFVWHRYAMRRYWIIHW